MVRSTGRSYGLRGRRPPVCAAVAARRTPPHCDACFYAGLGVLVLAIDSPVDAYADRLFWVHMVQHVLLTMVAPPLLLLGRPWPELRPLPRCRPAAVSPVRSTPAGRSRRRLAAFVLFNGVLLAWHIPVLYDSTLRNAGVHDLEHAMFFVTALLFWPHLVPTSRRPRLSDCAAGRVRRGRDPRQLGARGRARLRLRSALLRYAALAHRPGGLSALADQQLAAGSCGCPPRSRSRSPSSRGLSPRRAHRGATSRPSTKGDLMLASFSPRPCSRSVAARAPCRGRRLVVSRPAVATRSRSTARRLRDRGRARRRSSGSFSACILHNAFGTSSAQLVPRCPRSTARRPGRPAQVQPRPFALRDQHGPAMRARVAPRSDRRARVHGLALQVRVPDRGRPARRRSAAAPGLVAPAARRSSASTSPDTPRSVATAARKWHLPAGFEWLLGTHAQLAPVWSAYGIAVLPTEKRRHRHTATRSI